MSGTDAESLAPFSPDSADFPNFMMRGCPVARGGSQWRQIAGIALFPPVSMAYFQSGICN
ncbi:MAG: hypothetical protein ACMVY4_07735 [Minwuia sp.]|uniref:hypothetical protein n=1 Tax=Minwuia sp. TaxID=2493630 RepID=UPI003A89C7D7